MSIMLTRYCLIERNRLTHDKMDHTLICAALQGHIEIVKFLVTAGADVNHADKVLPH